MMGPFMPEGDPGLTGAIEAIFVPLFLLAACASVGWGLQDRYSAVVGAMRALAKEYRAPDNATRPAVLHELRLLLHRARLIRTAVMGFYLTMLFQVGSSACVGLVYVRITRSALPALFLFEAGLVILFAAVAVTFADTVLSYRVAEEEAREAGLCE